MPSESPAGSRSQARKPLLIVNGGSSSIRFALFDDGEAAAPRRLTSGHLSGIGLASCVLKITDRDGTQNEERPGPVPFEAAIALVIDRVRGLIPGGPRAAGHRIVHGGPDHSAPVAIDAGLLEALRGLSAFDPEHLPGEIRLAEAFGAAFPEAPQFACFDTAFHRDLPDVARTLPIPRRYTEAGVRRYGFHGLSCEFLMDALRGVAGEPAARGRVILAHLGGGASLTAVRDGKSVDTTMAFTPAAGIPMSTRTGDLDPGVAAYIAMRDGLSPAKLQHLFNHESGLLGVSGTTGDMRALLEAEKSDPRAALAVEYFCHHAAKAVGALAVSLGGLDTLVFAGGVGEHAPSVRARIAAKLAFLGVALDDVANAADAPVISSGRVAVRVIPTDEEAVIARHVAALSNT